MSRYQIFDRRDRSIIHQGEYSTFILCVEDAVNKGVALRAADLQRADLSRTNLQRSNLQGADLQRANLQRSNLQGANLQGADLSRTNLQGADLSQTNLQGADLSRTNLQRADLQRANLQWANLSQTNLQRADLQGANLSQTNLRVAVLGHNSIIDAGQDVRGFRFVANQREGKVAIWAGCRGPWTIKEAFNHWSLAHGSDFPLKSECLAKVEFIKTVANARGWIKTQDPRTPEELPPNYATYRAPGAAPAYGEKFVVGDSPKGVTKTIDEDPLLSKERALLAQMQDFLSTVRRKLNDK